MRISSLFDESNAINIEENLDRAAGAPGNGKML